MVDLREDGEQVRQLWRSNGDAHVPLALAAALAFHEARDGVHGVMPEYEYDDALDLMAAALSRLLTIYTLDGGTPQAVGGRLNLATGKFRRGAKVYEHSTGKALTMLVVSRDDLPAAVEVVKATRVPFSVGLR